MMPSAWPMLLAALFCCEEVEGQGNGATYSAKVICLVCGGAQILTLESWL